MKLSLILEQARAGELSAVSAKDKTDRKIVSYINLAMVALYNKFQLVTEEAIIALQTDATKTVYSLDGSDPDVTVAGLPMEEDGFMAIVSAFNEDGTEAYINDESQASSLYTISYNRLQIPLIAEHAYVSILYRKNPRLITYVDDGTQHAVDTQVDIPLQLLDAMLHYIGYRAHGAIDGNIQAETNTHYTRFMTACEAAVLGGIITPDDTKLQSVESKGFL